MAKKKPLGPVGGVPCPNACPPGGKSVAAFKSGNAFEIKKWADYRCHFCDNYGSVRATPLVYKALITDVILHPQTAATQIYILDVRLWYGATIRVPIPVHVAEQKTSNKYYNDAIQSEYARDALAGWLKNPDKALLPQIYARLEAAAAGVVPSAASKLIEKTKDDMQASIAAYTKEIYEKQVMMLTATPSYADLSSSFSMSDHQHAPPKYSIGDYIDVNIGQYEPSGASVVGALRTAIGDDGFNSKHRCPRCVREYREQVAEGQFVYPPDMTDLQRIIVHLNDVHRADRNEIADWLDTLDVDLSFKSQEEQQKTKKKAPLVKKAFGGPSGPITIPPYNVTIAISKNDDYESYTVHVRNDNPGFCRVVVKHRKTSEPGPGKVWSDWTMAPGENRLFQYQPDHEIVGVYVNDKIIYGGE